MDNLFEIDSNAIYSSTSNALRQDMRSGYHFSCPVIAKIQVHNIMFYFEDHIIQIDVDQHILLRQISSLHC